ncbi:hypothetical protein F5Y03DRAFT_367018 [Xylaria venustula]|nr:hypothetical protein F5Y03DRAFT_367018 [Xylaria venustula]
MGSDQDATKGLFRLPPEIRDQIYTELLHPENNRKLLDDGYSEYDYRAALVLFRLSRDIYHEARDVFRALNVFVRIETPWPEAEQHVSHIGHVPILMRGPRAARFKGHTLHATIETPAAGEPEHGTFHFVVLADDIVGFTRAWFYWNLSHPGLNQWLTLRLVLRDPYAADWDEPHVRRDVQRRLLLPFGDVKGLHEFSATGDPKPLPKIVAELRALQAEEPQSPEKCLAEGIRLKNEGNNLLRKGDYAGALAVYNRAWEAIHIVVQGRQRHVHAEAFFARDLVDEPFAGKNGQLERMALRLQLVANTCQVYLKLCDWQELQFWGMRTIQLMRQATGANERHISPEDEALPSFPGAAQVGKIYYRTALAYIGLGDRDEAMRLLRVAQVYLPADKIVKETLASLALKIG